MSDIPAQKVRTAMSNLLESEGLFDTTAPNWKPYLEDILTVLQTISGLIPKNQIPYGNALGNGLTSDVNATRDPSKFFLTEIISVNGTIEGALSSQPKFAVVDPEPVTGAAIIDTATGKLYILILADSSGTFGADVWQGPALANGLGGTYRQTLTVRQAGIHVNLNVSGGISSYRLPNNGGTKGQLVIQTDTGGIGNLDIADLSKVVSALPAFKNDVQAGISGLTTGMLYQTDGTDIVLITKGMVMIKQ